MKEINTKYYKKMEFSGSKDAKVLTNEQFQNGEQGYILAPYILKEHTDESLKDYKIFMKKYHKEHEVCPQCGSKECMSTLMGYPLYSDKRDEYRDLNSCECTACGDHHIAHQRISLKEFKKLNKQQK